MGEESELQLKKHIPSEIKLKHSTAISSLLKTKREKCHCYMVWTCNELKSEKKARPHESWVTGKPRKQVFLSE